MNTRLRINPNTTAAVESPALSLRSERVKSVMSADASKGRNKTSQGNAGSVILKLHQRQVLHMRGPALAVKRDNQRETDRDLGGRHCDDEENEDLSIQVIVEPRKGYQGQVGRIQHQLQPHIDYQQISPHDHSQQPQTKQDDADREIVRQ